MLDLFLWFPEDFDKRYEEYQNKFPIKKDGLPEPFLLNRLFDDRENIAGIKDKKEFEDEVEKWKPLKLVVDAVYKELSPLTDTAQTINISLAQLGLSENMARPVLLTLIYERVCRWKMSASSAVISSAPVAEYMQGEGIVVQDYSQFRDFRKHIQEFFNFIEQTKKEKFSEPEASIPIGNLSSPKESQLRALSSILEKEKEKDAIAEKVLEKIDERQQPKIETPQNKILPVIEYNPTTGMGVVNSDKKFKFKDGSPEHNIFNQLYSKMPKKLPRQDVLIAGEFYQDYENPDPTKKTLETAFINDKVISIREKTGLNTEQLVNNAGNLTLLGKKSDKSGVKEVKYTAVWG